jgi:hypothetical protein
VPRRESRPGTPGTCSADKPARGKTRLARTAVETEIATICKPRRVSDLLTTTLTGD